MPADEYDVFTIMVGKSKALRYEDTRIINFFWTFYPPIFSSAHFVEPLVYFCYIQTEFWNHVVQQFPCKKNVKPVDQVLHNNNS